MLKLTNDNLRYHMLGLDATNLLITKNIGYSKKCVKPHWSPFNKMLIPWQLVYMIISPSFTDTSHALSWASTNFLLPHMGHMWGRMKHYVAQERG